ncbi:hypothetical protein EV702DRAFT_130054 [Suillus placidus]|uniref:Cytochrome P450 n=1 Tax=Suillus placidus TaxID=48579 RepID=A0A9P6ZFQ3_9AGAM|nr:hypothetical protein EV702DRAFT_130054 [Suillus placidus]
MQKRFRIPAGATVYGCHWAISHDSFPFGFGRRFCPGQYLASDSILITLAYLFWAFRILEPKDAAIDRLDVKHLEEVVGQS